MLARIAQGCFYMPLQSKVSPSTRLHLVTCALLSVLCPFYSGRKSYWQPCKTTLTS